MTRLHALLATILTTGVAVVTLLLLQWMLG